MEHFIEWQVCDGRLVWKFLEPKIKNAETLDGCYIIFTDIDNKRLNKELTVKSYKNLIMVEQAFRQLKTVLLELRPIYHKTDDRIRCHVFICMLSYYLLWHFKNKVRELIDDENNKGKNRYWTLEKILERLKSIRKETKEIKEIKYYDITKPDNEQEKILRLLNIKL